MKTRTFRNTVSAAALGLAMWAAPGAVYSQPMYDRIKANIPYKITVGEKTLEPGDYTIQQLPSQSSSRILLFYTKDGMKFETSAMTIPALDPDTARDTKLILNKVGDDYYVHKIWVQGKDYGYELPIPKGLKDREKEATMAAATVTGTSTSAPLDTTQATDDTRATTDTKATNDTQATTQPTSPTAQATMPPPVTSQTEQKSINQDQNTAAITPAPTPTPTTPAVDANANSADRAVPEPQATTPATAPSASTSTPAMPSTAANWLTMLLGGGTLSGLGLMLRRKG